VEDGIDETADLRDGQRDEAIAAAVAAPERLHGAEIDLAGDALTFTEIAAVLSKAAHSDITAIFLSREEQEQRIGAPAADNQIWQDRVGYPARPHDAVRNGLTTTTFEQWAAQQDWQALRQLTLDYTELESPGREDPQARPPRPRPDGRRTDHRLHRRPRQHPHHPSPAAAAPSPT
jgi:hypothetical protein